MSAIISIAGGLADDVVEPPVITWLDVPVDMSIRVRTPEASQAMYNGAIPPYHGLEML